MIRHGTINSTGVHIHEVEIGVIMRHKSCSEDGVYEGYARKGFRHAPHVRLSR